MAGGEGYPAAERFERLGGVQNHRSVGVARDPVKTTAPSAEPDSDPIAAL